MLTEAEAKTKWCPMHRFAIDPASQSFHGNMPNPEAITCAGSGCMAWRWGDAFFRAGEHVFPRTRDEVATMKALGAVQCGFCGLAGKP